MIMTCRKKKIQHKYLNKKIWPKIYDAPEPTLILWRNLGHGQLNRFIRRTIVQIVSLAIIAVGFFAIAKGEDIQNNAKLKSNNSEVFEPILCDQNVPVSK